MLSKTQLKKQAKRARNQERKRTLKETGEWKNRKRRNEREFHVSTRVTPDMLKITEYHIHQGWRFVQPYLYTFQVYAKSRWFRKTLLELFQTEFGGYSDAYFVRIKSNCHPILTVTR